MNILGILATVGKALSYVPAPLLDLGKTVVEHALGAKADRDPARRISALRKAREDADARDAKR